MGPVGWQEMAIIFILALVLFGPKKLPELGRTLGKALTEFRRATSELKSTFEQHMNELERETQSLKEVTNSYTADVHNYYDSPYHDHGAYGVESHSSTESHPSTVSASAPEGAENSTVHDTVARTVSPDAQHSVPEAAAVKEEHAG